MAAYGESLGTYGDHKHILDDHLSMGSHVSKTFGKKQNLESNLIKKKYPKICLQKKFK